MSISSLKKPWQNMPRKARRWCAWLAGALLLYLILGFLVVPPILKSQIVKRLPEITKRQVAVRQVQFNPLALSLTIRGLALTEPDGEPFAGWEEFYINFQAASLFHWAWTFAEIRLSEPYGEIKLLKDGQLNFANMFQNADEDPKPKDNSGSGVPRVLISLLTITNGFVGIEDYTRRKPFRTEYKPINIRLTDFTTQPGTMTPYAFKAENDSGKSLAWAGDITVQPFASKGSIEVRSADPKKYQPYLEDYTIATITSGKADARFDYAFSTGTNGLDLSVSNGIFRLSDLKVEDPATKETVFSVPSCTIEGASLDLRDRQARIGLARIRDLDLLARINKDHSINLLGLLQIEPTNAPAPAPRTVAVTTNEVAAPWNVSLGEFHLENAAATLQDQSRNLPFETRLKPVQLSITNLTTATNIDADYSFAIATESSENLGGAGTVAINPVHSKGSLKVENVELKKYRPFADPFLRGVIAGGKLDLRGDYAFALAGTNLSLVLSNGLIALSELQVQNASTSEPVVALGSLKLEQIEADLEKCKASVGRVSTADTKLLVRKQADGTINLLDLLPPGTNDSTKGTASVPATHHRGARTASEGTSDHPFPWSVVLREFDLRQWQVHWEDLALPAPALLIADDIALNVKGLSTDLTRPAELTLALRLNNDGMISVRGEARAEPQMASLDIKVDGLELSSFQPYANPYVRLTINSGALNVNGRAVYQAANTNQPGAEFQGNVSITNLLTTDQVEHQEFIRWTDLRLEGIDFAQRPGRVKVDAIRMDGLKTSLLIDSNKQANLMAIFPPATNATPVQSPVAKPEPATAADLEPQMPVSVGLLTLTNTSFRFGDTSIQPNCRFAIQQLNGTIKGLSSDSGATADVDISGRVDDQAPFALFGKINPLAKPLTLDMTFSNANMQLPSFTPYLEKYAGHPLNKGRLSMELHYAIQKNALKAENSFRIDQFTLGARNNSPDATKLPVKLAIALLKDRNGRIELDVPVTGRLDDPEFKIGPIIWKVVMNVITKAATSPFKLLGSLVGGGEELSYVDFEPGTATLLAGETNKIDKLTKALAERPAINLEIDSSVDPAADRHALALQELKDRLKSERLAELAASKQAPPAAESYEIDPPNYERLLRAEFVKAYGTNWTEALAKLRAEAETNLAMASISGNTNRATAASVKPRSKLAIALQVIASWNPFERKNSPTGAARRQAISDARLVRENPALATLTPELMEHLLALKTEVPEEALMALMKSRTQAVQTHLLRSGEIQADRTFLVAPKPVGSGYVGQARSTLTIN